MEHVFKVDPVMIGTVPRYRHDDVQAWIDRLEGLRGAPDAVRYPPRCLWVSGLFGPSLAHTYSLFHMILGPEREA